MYPEKKLARTRGPTYPRNEFIPAISVRRSLHPVLLETGTADLIHEKLKATLEERLLAKSSRGKWVKLLRYSQVLPPSEWGVTLLEQSRLLAEMRYQKKSPKIQEIWGASGMVRRALVGQLADTPSYLKIPLGSPQTFGYDNPQKVIGIVPKGWKERRVHYEQRDKFDRHLAVGSVVAENAMCVKAVAQTLGIQNRIYFHLLR